MQNLETMKENLCCFCVVVKTRFKMKSAPNICYHCEVIGKNSCINIWVLQWKLADYDKNSIATYGPHIIHSVYILHADWSTNKDSGQIGTSNSKYSMP